MEEWKRKDRKKDGKKKGKGWEWKVFCQSPVNDVIEKKRHKVDDDALEEEARRI